MATARGTSTGGATSTEDEYADGKYSRFLVFVDDPKSRSLFQVLHTSYILSYKTGEELGLAYLNKSRRKRKYDVEFARHLKHSCRIFAKCDDKLPDTRLNEYIADLNMQFNNLMTCRVPVEAVYEMLVESHAYKVKDGICYITDHVVNKRARQSALPDTASSYTDASDDVPKLTARGKPGRRWRRRCPAQ